MGRGDCDFAGHGITLLGDVTGYERPIGAASIPGSLAGQEHIFVQGNGRKAGDGEIVSQKRGGLVEIMRAQGGGEGGCSLGVAHAKSPLTAIDDGMPACYGQATMRPL